MVRSNHDWRKMKAELVELLLLPVVAVTLFLFLPRMNSTILAQIFLVAAAYSMFISLTRREDPPILGHSLQPLCKICDYNLTGNISGVCPECGTKIQA